MESILLLIPKALPIALSLQFDLYQLRRPKILSSCTMRILGTLETRGPTLLACLLVPHLEVGDHS